MEFLHNYKHEPFPEMEVHNIGGMRFYEAPNGLKYPSITTVLGKRPGKQEGLQKWRDRVGEQQARAISGKAARRGTAFHFCVEDYLQNQPIGDKHKEKNFLAYHMFQESRKHLDNSVNQIVLQEQAMYSDMFKVAGRCDAIAVYDNELAVVDFKTTTTMKKREWLEDYFIQCSAYASMYEEHTGEPIDRVVIFMVAEDGQIEIFKEDTKDYLPMLDEMMEEFYDNVELKEENT
jgi:hypothetical protein